MSTSADRRLVVLVIAVVVALVVPIVGGGATGGAGAQTPTTPEQPPALAALEQFRLTEDRPLDDRLAQPEDRYAPAGGCYTLEAPGVGHVARSADGLVLATDSAAAEPFHFQATRLGRYLLATNEGPDTTHDGAWWDVRGYLAAAGLLPDLDTVLAELGLDGLPLPGDGIVDEAPLPALPTTDALTIAGAPGEAADWELVAEGDDVERRAEEGQGYVLSLPEIGKALAVRDGAPTLVDGAAGDPFVLHHVPDGPDGRVCATWPEIPTNTSGEPAPVEGSPVGEVEGLFEAHVHGMAFEFLGGELRCGRPWHPYGVEYALPDCQEDGQVLNPGSEVVLANADPSTYDPVGWPTFAAWPNHDLLTHEQWYWRWLERAHHGGLRLLTNLLVENTALCQLYPQKKNSCNEMDSIRLQAQRLYELQDYIDAQSGGPGEGWFRIVTTPAQARQAINDGRLAVVIGIEVSVLFDCGEIMGEPQCTREQIDQRVDEVHAMGVRQIELINKFDNALSGVAGDGGTTGIIVNQGNRLVTGHYWDMRSCPEESSHAHGIEGTEHDKTQLNPSDDLGLTDTGGDVLAATLLDQFGGVVSAAAPLYPPAPHCNSLGLTDLGAHAVRRILDRGIIFDPDHMSAAGQREALDLIEHEIIPERQAEAADEHGPEVLPALISSHSWANDVSYQRILQLGGHVAPMNGSADSFANRWAQRREWADDLLPDGVTFGMGYGADVNGFASQPGPRDDPAQPLTYDDGWEAPVGGVQIFQQTSGLRSFDVNVDGVAHYGLYADWFRELQLAADEQHPDLGGGEQLVADMLAGPEHFLQMWERGLYGVSRCVADQSGLQLEDLHALLGVNLEGFLEAVGQPIDRDGAVYTYCVAGEDGSPEPIDVEFDDEGNASQTSPGDDPVTPTPAPDHTHDGPSLPATGDGSLALALLLLGLALVGSTRFGAGRSGNA